MAASKFECEIALEDLKGEEHEFLVKCTIAPGTPGRLSGPPEDCYPAEGPEVDDLKLYKNTGQRDDKGRPIFIQVPEEQWEQYGTDEEALTLIVLEKANEASEPDFEERERED